MKSTILSILGLLLLIVGIVSYAGARTDVNSKLEEAIRQDFIDVRAGLELPQELEGAEPKTPDEVEEWTERARNVRDRMQEIAGRSIERRNEIIAWLATLPGDTEYPLANPTRAYFEAENEYFRLVEESQNRSSVVLIAGGKAASDQENNSFLAITRQILTAYDRLLEAQSSLLSASRTQAMNLQPVWDGAYRQQLVESIRIVEGYGKKRPG